MRPQARREGIGAQIASHAQRGQAGLTSLRRPGPLTPATYPLALHYAGASELCSRAGAAL